MQQAQNQEVNFVVAKLENYKKTTLKHIKEKALKQVNEARTHLMKKLQKETLEELSYLIKKTMNPLVEETKECVADALKEIKEAKGAKQLEDLYTNTIQENQKIFKDDHMNEARTFVKEETPAHLEEALRNLDRKLTKRVNDAVEKLQTEISRQGNRDEKQSITDRLNKCIFEKVKRSKEETVRFLVNKARDCQTKALKKIH